MCKQIYEGERAKAFISLFEDNKILQQVAELRFVENMTIPQIAEEMCYCQRQIDRFIKKIKQISEVMEQ